MSGEEELPRSAKVARYAAVGCFTFVTGAFSGGMVFVLIAKIVGTVNRCTPQEGLPACDWHIYAGVGMLIGATTLPILAIRRLRRGQERVDQSEGS